MNAERRMETSGPVLMKDAEGVTYEVFIELTLERSRYLNNKPSDWLEISRRLFTTTSLVKPRGQGWYEVVATGTRIREWPLEQPRGGTA